jgi:NTP pyrophosphatase (non-canonical NTP hydrolase)
MTGLTFAEVRAINLQRAERWHPGFPADSDWSLADWSNAMCGEAGEAANVVKKLRRHETGAAGTLDPSPEHLRRQLADEIADVYLYLDLLAQKAGVDITAAIVRKFNIVSLRQGWPDLQLDEAPRFAGGDRVRFHGGPSVGTVTLVLLHYGGRNAHRYYANFDGRRSAGAYAEDVKLAEA